jgi:hypothetical protein
MLPLSWPRQEWDIDFDKPQNSKIWCDNISSISLASNPLFHARTRHLEVDYHYVREKVIRRELEVDYICTQDQLADIFTKGLSPARFRSLVSKLPVLSRPLSLRGDDKPQNSKFKSSSSSATSNRSCSSLPSWSCHFEFQIVLSLFCYSDMYLISLFS